jgi:hypothetical protein
MQGGRVKMPNISLSKLLRATLAVDIEGGQLSGKMRLLNKHDKKT